MDFPVAKEGSRQSPIDIDTNSAEKVSQIFIKFYKIILVLANLGFQDDSLADIPLEWGYSPEKVLHVENTGHSWTVKVDGSESCEIQQ